MAVATVHRTRTWHSAWSCRALTLDPALVDADQEPRLDDSTDSNGNMKTSYHTFTHLMALYDNVLSEKKLCFFTSFFPVSLLDVWTLEPGMSESFFLPCFFPFYKMSCIAFACVDRFLHTPSCATSYTFLGPNTRIDTTFPIQCI